MKKVCIIDSFCGCMLNAFDSQQFAQFFKENNYELEKDEKQADIILLNTCAFVKEVEDRVVEKINQLNKTKKPNQKVIITGCFPKINKEKLDQIFQGDSFGPREKEKINNIINAKVKINNININQVDDVFCKGAPSTRFYIKIADGCLGNCSFCSIKNARGSLQSRPKEIILKEFKKGLEKGFKEFVLLGDDLGCYGKDIQTSIPSLLKDLTKEGGEYKLFIHFFEPEYLLEYFDELIEILKTKKIALINLPIQSGNNDILKLMNRPYKIENILEKVKIIQNKFPEINLQTHILFAHPGETKETLNQSLKAAEVFDIAKFFCYSDRPGTVSSNLPNKLTNNQKQEMKNQINNYAKQHTRNYHVIL
jgi:MiaB/RimO family radical SAM methylthiotransferase